MEEINKTTKKDMFMIDPRSIVVVDGYNSRVDFDIDSLVESIKDEGVLNPISVIKIDDEHYRLVDGERRYRATMKANEQGAEIARIPAIVLPKSTSEEEMLVQQLLRNEGKPFTDYEMAVLCNKFKAKGWTATEIAKRIHKNNGMVTYWLKINDLDAELKSFFKEDKISHSEFHRIAEAHKDANGEIDVDSLINELQKGEAKAKENGKKRITLKDLDSNGKTITFRDSKTIKTGLAKLIERYAKYTNDGEYEIPIDIIDIYTRLSEGEDIDSIFESEVKKYKKVD